MGTCNYLELSSGSDWLCGKRNLFQPIESTTQILVEMRHQYGIYAVVAQTSFRAKPQVIQAYCLCYVRVL